MITKMEMEVAQKLLERQVEHSIKEFIRVTGCFPEIQIVENLECQLIGVKVISVRMKSKGN